MNIIDLMVGSKVILNDGSVGILESFKGNKFNFKNKRCGHYRWIKENEVLKKLPDKANK